jgi:hypothetical protein
MGSATSPNTSGQMPAERNPCLGGWFAYPPRLSVIADMPDRRPSATGGCEQSQQSGFYSTPRRRVAQIGPTGAVGTLHPFHVWGVARIEQERVIPTHPSLRFLP